MAKTRKNNAVARPTPADVALTAAFERGRTDFARRGGLAKSPAKSAAWEKNRRHPRAGGRGRTVEKSWERALTMAAQMVRDWGGEASSPRVSIDELADRIEKVPCPPYSTR